MTSGERLECKQGLSSDEIPIHDPVPCFAFSLLLLAYTGSWSTVLLLRMAVCFSTGTPTPRAVAFLRRLLYPVRHRHPSTMYAVLCTRYGCTIPCAGAGVVMRQGVPAAPGWWNRKLSSVSNPGENAGAEAGKDRRKRVIQNSEIMGIRTFCSPDQLSCLTNAGTQPHHPSLNRTITIVAWPGCRISPQY
ncbi:hypothetical protein BGX38DRAFT_1138569 [Terfezia claveryi]|nr:hypothetical protein BGX38DRAFT_1138569 [Terfezia claveryi]